MTGPAHHRPLGVVAVAVLLLAMSIGPATLLAVAASGAPWALPLAATAAGFGVVLAASLFRGRSWALCATIVVLCGATAEAVLFSAVNVLALDRETIWPEGIAVAVAVAVLLLGAVALLARHRAWFTT